MAIQVTDTKKNTITMSNEEWDAILRLASGHSEALPITKHESICFYHLYASDADESSVLPHDGTCSIIPKKHATKFARALNRVLGTLPPIGAADDSIARFNDEIKDLVLKLWFLSSHGSLEVRMA
jgi:hypothetical protein